jgi:D-alanyl-D-alanine carboxypeptidase
MKEKAMNKKSLLGLLLFACLVTAGLYAGANYFIGLESSSLAGAPDKADTTEVTTDQKPPENNANTPPMDMVEASLSSGEEKAATEPKQEITGAVSPNITVDTTSQEPWLGANPSDTGEAIVEVTVTPIPITERTVEEIKTTEDTFSTSVKGAKAPKLIEDSKKVDYMSYIPEIKIDTQLEAALDIKNPSLSVDAEAAILFDAKTKEILYHKNALQAEFPASTAKLLTALVALKWCGEEEEVKIGDEITMIGSGSTIAYLKKGQVLTIRNLLAGMLLPSGNDAAYAIAAYVGRKSLEDSKSTKEEAVAEFIRLMNKEAKKLGVKNSSFKTPDGYDAIGQYTTAYDMGLIGVAAANNKTIVEVTDQGKSRNIFPSGEDVTWTNTNKLVKRGYGQYYSKAIGLKTGTSTMAGKCIVAAAEEDGRKVVCAILDSTSTGRWEDAIALLKYGLNHD